VSEAASEWFTAIQKGQLDAMDAMLAADPSLASARDPNGLSAVTWACYARQSGALARLLAAHPPLDLFESVCAGQDDIALAWIARDGALVRAWSADGFTPLHYAAFFDRPALAEKLLAFGAAPAVAARNASAVQPLHSAAAAGATPIARMLLEYGADPDARQAGGFTALMSAAQQGRDELVALLLHHGADPELRADDGRAAADLADVKGHHALAARLRGAADPA